jgi:hypothetical protein
MKALIITPIEDVFFWENNFLNITSFNVIEVINQLLLKFDLNVFIIKESNDICETKIHKSLNLNNCKKDFYIFKKKKNNDNIFKNKEFKELFNKKEIDAIYIAGVDLNGEIKKMAVAASKSGYKTVVVENAIMPLSEDINKTLKIFKENNIYFLETWELEEFEKIKS